MMKNTFLPTSKEEMLERGWSELDVLLISADAYVDHPSFACALIGRLIENAGYRIGIVSQPNWKNTDDITCMGKPRLCTMISSGNIDSMVAHYTSTKKKRSDDRYSPGGKSGFRPDRPTIVYSNLVRQAFGKLPIIIGGLEASLRRLSHYDYWQDLVRKSILLDSKADLLVFGMGEHQTLEILKRLSEGVEIAKMHDIQGTCFSISGKDLDSVTDFEIVKLPSFEEVSERDKASNTPTESGKQSFAKAFNIAMQHENPFENVCLCQKCDNRYVIQNPPAKPLTQEEFDQLYEFPYVRKWHPKYDKFGGVPALSEVQFSIVSSRGCYGSCSFCAITNHQGRIIQTRSTQSLVREAKILTEHEDFKGYIHDLGGPTANFQCPSCDKQNTKGPCSNRECLFPKPCKNVKDSHELYMEKLKAVASVKGVKKVFIRSGIRFDYLMLCTTEEVRNKFIKQLVRDHVSGQLKIAPEHIDSKVLHYMGKSNVEVYDEFKKLFADENKAQNKKQYLIPYLIASHPGSDLQSAVNLALYMKKEGFIPDQVQEFYPTPATVSTCMYYTGLDPRPGYNFEKVYVPKGRDANLQRALLQFNKKENRAYVIEALEKIGRRDLIKVLLK